VRWGWSFALAGVTLVASVVVPPSVSGPTAGPRTFAPPRGHRTLTEAQAVDAAAGRAGVPAAARLMDYESAATLLGEGPDPRRAPSTPVWLVTVEGPQGFTVVLNGTDGTVIDSCIGCQVLG
jgi:hypothetical protein